MEKYAFSGVDFAALGEFGLKSHEKFLFCSGSARFLVFYK